MVRIAATIDWTFHVQTPMQQVYNFFAAPDQLCELLDSVETHELLREGHVRWVLKEKVEKGIRFKGDYTVIYQGNNVDHLHWHCVAGNMGNEGDVWLTTTTEHGTEIHYREMVAPDLPVTPLMACLIQPIVARELRTELGVFLERVKAHFEVDHDVP